MTFSRVAFLGGNGHCEARLEPARRALETAGYGFELVSVRYPGFEGRPRAGSFERFLADSAASVERPALVYASGIGGLIALCLRARGVWRETPMVFQAPVLWGLERRWFPRLMRLPGMARAAMPLFGTRWFQRRFLRKQFREPVDKDFAARFFEGYKRCAAFADFFDWLRPSLLRGLELDFAREPGALDGIRFHWGDQDQVVGLEELTITERALGRRFPLRRFPDWGHYPLIDEPEAWIASVKDALESA